MGALAGRIGAFVEQRGPDLRRGGVGNRSLCNTARVSGRSAAVSACGCWRPGAASEPIGSSPADLEVAVGGGTRPAQRSARLSGTNNRRRLSDRALGHLFDFGGGGRSRRDRRCPTVARAARGLFPGPRSRAARSPAPAPTARSLSAAALPLHRVARRVPARRGQAGERARVAGLAPHGRVECRLCRRSTAPFSPGPAASYPTSTSNSYAAVNERRLARSRDLRGRLVGHPTKMRTPAGRRHEHVILGDLLPAPTVDRPRFSGHSVEAARPCQGDEHGFDPPAVHR
jgi:hypothetical protein